MSLDLLEKPDINFDSKTDDPPLAHYAESVSVTEGYVLGTPVVAICGVIFVPSRDPKNLKICPECQEIADALFLNHE